MMRANVPDIIEQEVRRALRGIPRPWRDALADQILRGGKRQPKTGRHPDGGGAPVEPDGPRGLEGGAAAAVEFDD